VYALIASEEHKKHVLIFNQNVLDLFGCFVLGLTYAIKACNVHLAGTSGYWLCMMILSESSSLGLFMGSLINLVAISVERYLKVVHAIWSKKKLRNWMLKAAAAFPWIGGMAVAMSVVIPSANVVDGVCYTLFFWKSPTDQMAYGIWHFVSFYVIILLVCTFCYGRILVTIWQRARVNVAGTTNAQIQSNHIQANLIKTMVLVCVLFAVLWTPGSIFYLLRSLYL